MKTAGVETVEADIETGTAVEVRTVEMGTAKDAERVEAGVRAAGGHGDGVSGYGDGGRDGGGRYGRYGDGWGGDDAGDNEGRSKTVEAETQSARANTEVEEVGVEWKAEQDAKTKLVGTEIVPGVKKMLMDGTGAKQRRW